MKTETKKSLLIGLLLIIIGGLITWDLFIRKRPVPEPITIYEYKTDTIYKDKPYAVPEPYEVQLPPKTVTVYEVDSSGLEDLRIRIGKDQVIIDQLKDSVSYFMSMMFLKQFPNNPKLLSADISKNQLSFNFLHTTGLSSKESWPIDLDRFDYRWTFESDLSLHPTQSPPTEQGSYTQYFVGGGVDLLSLSPYVGGGIEHNLRTRIRLYGSVHVGLLDREGSALKVGIDYKFNGSGTNRIR